MITCRNAEGNAPWAKTHLDDSLEFRPQKDKYVFSKRLPFEWLGETGSEELDRIQLSEFPLSIGSK